jgi:hypothetical protein
MAFGPQNLTFASSAEGHSLAGIYCNGRWRSSTPRRCGTRLDRKRSTRQPMQLPARSRPMFTAAAGLLNTVSHRQDRGVIPINSIVSRYAHQTTDFDSYLGPAHHWLALCPFLDTSAPATENVACHVPVKSRTASLDEHFVIIDCRRFTRRLDQAATRLAKTSAFGLDSADRSFSQLCVGMPMASLSAPAAPANTES